MPPVPHRPEFNVRTWATAAVLTLAALLLMAPSPAAAASSLSAVNVSNGDLVLDKPAQLLVDGFADPADGSSPDVTIHINSPSLPCLQTRALNFSRRVDAVDSEVRAKTGQIAAQPLAWTPETTGDFLLCVYLYQAFSNDATETKAVLSKPITIRNPQASASATLIAGRFPSGSSTPLTVTSFAEVSRHLDVAMNPGGVPCGVNYRADQGSTTSLGFNVLGGPTVTTENLSVPSQPGLYHLCTYIHRDTSDATPLVVSDGPAFWSGAAKCTLSKAPKKTSKQPITITCSNTAGDVQIVATRGKKTIQLTRTLVDGKTTATTGQLGLQIKKATTVAVLQDGKKIGSRILRLTKAKKRR